MRAVGTVALGAAMIAAAGCGKVADEAAEKTAEKIVEEETGAKVDIDSEDGSYEVETEDGNVSVGTGEAPDGWPEDVPLDGIDIAGSSTADGGFYLSGTTDRSVAEVIDDYRAALADWEEISDGGAFAPTETSGAVAFEQGDRHVTVTATNTGGSTQVAIGVVQA